MKAHPNYIVSLVTIIVPFALIAGALAAFGAFELMWNFHLKVKAKGKLLVLLLVETSSSFIFGIFFISLLHYLTQSSFGDEICYPLELMNETK